MKLFGVLLLSWSGSMAEKPRPRQMSTVAVKNAAEQKEVLSGTSRPKFWLWVFCLTSLEKNCFQAIFGRFASVRKINQGFDPFLYLARGVCKIRIWIGFFLFVLKTGTSVFKQEFWKLVHLLGFEEECLLILHRRSLIGTNVHELPLVYNYTCLGRTTP